MEAYRKVFRIYISLRGYIGFTGGRNRSARENVNFCLLMELLRECSAELLSLLIILIKQFLGQTVPYCL